MTLNRANVRNFLHNFDFKNLFIEELGWGSVPNARPAPMDIDGARYLRRLIAQMSGVGVFEIYPADPSVKFPDAKTRAALHKLIEGLAHENLLIFLDDDHNRTQSLWYWVKRDGHKKQPREHLYLKGQPGDLFLSKLTGMVIELHDLRADGTLPITEATKRLAQSLDIERVTKKFYGEFSTLRVDFIDHIHGIPRDADRFWYASVLLNRLMFIYFLQKRGFIQNDTRYLDRKLDESKTRGADLYYREFLRALFFEGFAKPTNQRTPEARQLLGDIKYLNGGLFIPHKLELEHPDIRIPDSAFEGVLKLFGSYSWHLDDTPGADDDEINPDVLGYIFEKYINQKAFGAYYTRTEITEYLCERTIHAAVLDRLSENTTRTFADLGEVLLKLDADLCRRLLDVLPQISILDPACGSGAFLVAAMKTLLNLYAAVYGKIRFLHDTNLTAHLRDLDQNHKSINYYIRKRIITDNLYGVDIMEEAAEIAKLRLFLSMVSAAQSVEELEPLPNIDFNIMTGNSLVGLMAVDPKQVDSKTQMTDMFQAGKANDYVHVLNEKNRLIELYRKSSSQTENVQAIRQQIDDYKTRAYATLDRILLDDFQALRIQYEQAQASGKAKKRPLVLDDIRALHPFHWGYEFDAILGTRGGFDVIITNPPWEIFKPQAKEFFAQYSELVTKNKMTIKDFEQQQAHMLKDPEIQAAWLRYQSSYPHVSAYYRSAPQYKNQISKVNGKKAGSDINLYKLFTEQALNLLKPNGQCGIVIPSGIYTDLGTKQLREMLFEQTTITGLFGFENRNEIFEGVHRSFKFVVLTMRKSGHTTAFPAAFMRHDVKELEQFPRQDSLMMRVSTIRKLSPDSLSIPEYKNEMDARIAEKLLAFPLLGEQRTDTWNLKLAREFDMTNDSDLFRTAPGEGRLPLYEGKMIHQFTHQWEGASARYWVDEKEGRQRVLGKRAKDNGQHLDYQGYRLGFRAVASSTNERSLISTVTPPSFAGNSLIVSIGLPSVEALYAASVMNSFLMDWILRQRVTTNINMFYIYQGMRSLRPSCRARRSSSAPRRSSMRWRGR